MIAAEPAISRYLLRMDCRSCGSLPAELEIENEQGAGTPQEFPPAFRTLRELNSSRSPSSLWPCVLKCPACGAYFRLTERIPGGSEDVFRTWIIRTLERVSPADAKVTLERARAALERCGGMDDEVRRVAAALAKERAAARGTGGA